MKKVLGLILLLAALLFVLPGCTGKQVTSISDMTVDAILLDDAVNAQKDLLLVYMETMPPEKQITVLDALAKIEDVQANVKALITLDNPETIAPVKILSLYLDAKSVTLDLKDALYDETENFITWNNIPQPGQRDLSRLYQQARDLGASIETYLTDPENKEAIDIARDVATYSYLALKILTLASSI